MSLREEIQGRIASALRESAEWTAPYGVLAGTRAYGKGKVRTVAFGVARSLDAELLIVRVDRLELRAEGPLAHACPKCFDTCDSFLRWAANPWRIGGAA